MSTEPRETERFNPAEHFRSLKGQQYLETKWRLVWFRGEHPGGQVVTEMLEHDAANGLAVFKAKVTYTDDISGGFTAIGTGHGSETRKDFADYLEKAECLELGALILTRDGFKDHLSVSVGEPVLAYDIAADQCVWTPLLGVTTWVQAPTVRMGGTWFEVVMTAEHSWATAAAYSLRRPATPARRLKKATHLTSSDRLILAAPAPGGASPLTPDDAAILGWLFTDGSIWKKEVLDASICQSKPATVERIRTLVGSVATEHVGKPTTRTFPSGRTYDCLPQHLFDLPARYARKLLAKAGGLASPADLPRLIPTLSAPARASMLEAMMEADGDSRGYFGKQRKPGVMEAWQMLCTLEGRAVGPRRNEAVFPVQRMKRRRYVSVSELQVTDCGKRDVWCPTTRYGTWVTRLPNGQVTITGNTKAIGRALAVLGYGTQFAQELDEGLEKGGLSAAADSPVDAKPARTQTPPARRPAPGMHEPTSQQQPARAQTNDEAAAGALAKLQRQLHEKTQHDQEGRLLLLQYLKAQGKTRISEMDAGETTEWLMVLNDRETTPDAAPAAVVAAV